MAVGLLVVGGLTPWTLNRHGVFSGSEVLYLTYPTSDQSNTLAQQAESVIAFGGTIARYASERPDPYRFSSALAPIYGSGQTEATSIRPYDAGGQWNRRFNRPFIIIEVVSTTAQGARDRMDKASAAVESAVLTLQNQADIPADLRVDSFPAVSPAPIAEVRGSRTRALAMSLLLGLGAMLMTASWLRARAAAGDRG